MIIIISSPTSSLNVPFIDVFKDKESLSWHVWQRSSYLKVPLSMRHNDRTSIDNLANILEELQDKDTSYTIEKATIKEARELIKDDKHAITQFHGYVDKSYEEAQRNDDKARLGLPVTNLERIAGAVYSVRHTVDGHVEMSNEHYAHLKSILEAS